MIRVLMGLLLVSVMLFAAAVSDNQIYDQVRLKLSADRDVRGGAIEVKVDKGVVELSGTVKSDKARSRAEKIAKKIKGVDKVVNKLTVAQ